MQGSHLKANLTFSSCTTSKKIKFNLVPLHNIFEYNQGYTRQSYPRSPGKSSIKCTFFNQIKSSFSKSNSQGNPIFFLPPEDCNQPKSPLVTPRKRLHCIWPPTGAQSDHRVDGALAGKDHVIDRLVDYESDFELGRLQASIEYKSIKIEQEHGLK